MPEQVWRVGSKQPQNVYCGDRYVGVMFTSETAALIVAAMNGGAGPIAPHADQVTPAGIAATVQNALQRAGIPIDSVHMNISMMMHSPSVSILKAGTGDYTAEEAASIAAHLGAGLDFNQHKSSATGEQLATLRGATPDGLGVTIHREPEASS